MPDRVTFRGCTLNLADKQEVFAALGQATKPLIIATVNPEFIELAQYDAAFKKSLEEADLCTVEGTGFAIGLWFSRLFNAKIVRKQRYPGVQLVEDLISHYADTEKSFGFLGGEPGIAKAFAIKKQEQYPNLTVAFTDDGGVIDSKNPEISTQQQKLLTTHKPDILFVGFGAPKQERWMQAARSLHIPVMIGVGGTFGFDTTKKRAPKLMSTLGLEWLYRGATEPGHWQRVWRAFPVFATKTAWWAMRTRGGKADRKS